MSARQKLNVAYLNSCALVAALLGVAAGSWAVFLVALAVLVASGVYAGEIRTGGRRR